jgi:hypothetical protein
VLGADATLSPVTVFRLSNLGEVVIHLPTVALRRYCGSAAPNLPYLGEIESSSALRGCFLAAPIGSGLVRSARARRVP